MATMTLAIPTIHRNGTSANELQQQIADATSTLRVAEKALNEAYPNARDYYPQGPDAILVATRQHDDRVSRLRMIRAELEEMADAIVDGGHKRA